MFASIYQKLITNVSSEEERFNLTLQIRRAVADIPSRIVEVERRLKTMLKSFESKHLTTWLLEPLDPWTLFSS
jgi:hypothetical protein